MGGRATSTGYGIRLGLHLVKGIGEVEGEALDAEIERSGPYKSLPDLVARTELAEEIVERLIRAGALDSLGEPRRKLLWQLREVAGATRGRYDGRTVGSKKAQGRPIDLRLPPTTAPDLPPPTELERLGDSYAILSLDARRQVVELFRPALDALGVQRAGELVDTRPGMVRICGLGRHPPAPDDRARHRLPGTRGRDGDGQRHALAGHMGQLPRRCPAPCPALHRRPARARVGRGQRHRATMSKSLVEVARPAGGPFAPQGVRHMGHAGMRRVG